MQSGTEGSQPESAPESLRESARRRAEMQEALVEALRVAEERGPQLLAAMDRRVERVLEVTERTDDALDRIERESLAAARRVSGILERSQRSADEVIYRLKTEVRDLRWRVWLTSALVGVVISLLVFVGLTLLRPGWALTANQRDALDVGERAMRRYQVMTPAERRTFQKLLGEP